MTPRPMPEGLSPATHYALEAVRGEVSGVNERVDKLEESQGRHRTMFEQVKWEIAEFKRQVATDSSSTAVYLKVISWAAGVMATGILAILGMLAKAVISGHIK